MVIRNRHAQNECSLPKGKLDPGEEWEQAALREVLEETGSAAGIVGFGGALPYYVGPRPKIVVYFEMVAVPGGVFTPSREVVDMAWLAPAAALARLSYESERNMLRALLKGRRPGQAPGAIA